MRARSNTPNWAGIPDPGKLGAEAAVNWAGTKYGTGNCGTDQNCLIAEQVLKMYDLPIDRRAEYKVLFDEQKTKLDNVVEGPMRTYNRIGDTNSCNP